MNVLSRCGTMALAGWGLWATPGLAQDIANGELQFSRQCVACHVVRDDEGRALAGRNARTGPNLHGIDGRVVGAVEGFRYGDAMERMRDSGTAWDESRFVGYVQDPTAWLRSMLDDRRARGKMAYRVRDPQDAADIWAYLTQLGQAE